MPVSFNNLLPQPGDALRALEAKILLSLNKSSGGTTVCITGGLGPPSGTPPCNFSVYVQQPGPNFGLWLGDTVTGWGNVIAQGP